MYWLEMLWDTVVVIVNILLWELAIYLGIIGFLKVEDRFDMKKTQTGLYIFALIVTTVSLYLSIFNNPTSYKPVVDNVAEHLIVVLIILCLLPYIKSIMPTIKSMKILDFIEFSREIKQVKESVNSGLDNINRTLSTLIAIQNVNTVQHNNQRMEFTVNVVNQIDDIKKLANDLKPRYKIDESDIPSPSIDKGDKTSSLLRLRLNIEEKIRSIAPLADIPPAQDVINIVKSLRGRELIDYVLAESIEKIIRVTREVTEMGIELRSELTDEIIRSGGLTLVALGKVEERIKQRYSRNNQGFSEGSNENKRSNL